VSQTRYIYKTNNILFESETVASVDDIVETSNHFKVLDYMLNNVNKELKDGMMKDFYRILKERTMDCRKE